MAQTLMMKELDVHIGGNTVWISHDKAECQKIKERSCTIWLEKCKIIHVRDYNDLSSFKII